MAARFPIAALVAAAFAPGLLQEPLARPGRWRSGWGITRDMRNRLMYKTLIALAGAGLLIAACTTTGNVERNAAGGAALGAVAGAVIGNNTGSGDAGTGAAIGAVVGGAAGAIKGCRDDGGCGAGATTRRQYYDEAAGRYYYYDRAKGRYYWEDGRPRT